jgi:hypothetical protein
MRATRATNEELVEAILHALEMHVLRSARDERIESTREAIARRQVGIGL